MSTDAKVKDLYSVEISHIYLDQHFSIDQIRSVERFHSEAPSWGKTHSEIVLFDNYNVAKIITTPEEVLDQLRKINASPKYFAFEKDLIDYSRYLIDAIKIPKIKKQYELYIEKNNKYPCSLLTSVWYLMRLGYIKDTKRIIKSVDEGDSYQSAVGLINFLPNHFMAVEKKSTKLLRATHFSEAVDQIENIYFDSDTSDSVLKKDLV